MPPRTPAQPKVRITADLSPELYEALRQKAQELGSQQAVVLAALTAYLTSGTQKSANAP